MNKTQRDESVPPPGFHWAPKESLNYGRVVRRAFVCGLKDAWRHYDSEKAQVPPTPQIGHDSQKAAETYARKTEAFSGTTQLNAIQDFLAGVEWKEAASANTELDVGLVEETAEIIKRNAKTMPFNSTIAIELRMAYDNIKTWLSAHKK